MTDFKDVSWGDRARYAWSAIIHFAPVAFLLNVLHWWFANNSQFGGFMCAALVINMVVGAIMHLKFKTFVVKSFIWKNVEMAFVIIVVYILLEMLRYTSGDNIAGDIFRILIQVMTLLYPTSKVCKNIFILTKGKYPPEFLMRKLYSFERNGDLGKLFSTKNDNTADNADFEKYQNDLKNEK